MASYLAFLDLDFMSGSRQKRPAMTTIMSTMSPTTLPMAIPAMAPAERPSPASTW